MENWYAIYEIGRLRQKELEQNAERLRLIRAASRGKRQDFKRMYRKNLASLGKNLETLGQMLQKRYQKC